MELSLSLENMDFKTISLALNCVQSAHGNKLEADESVCASYTVTGIITFRNWGFLIDLTS